jgi:hypothetical protein
MADYSAMKFYREKNNLHYFTFSLNSEKPMKPVIRHLPPDTPGEDISNSLEDLDFTVINVRQMTVIRRVPNEQPHVETFALFLVTLTRNIKSQNIYKLNSLNHIMIKGRVTQSSNWPYAVLQMPKLWPCLVQLQATPSTFVVQWWPPAKPVRELHVALKIPHVYEYVTKLCRAWSEVILNHVNPNVRGTGQGEAMHRKCKGLKLGGG